MKVQVNALALEQAITAVGKFYGIDNLAVSVREVYDKIDGIHAERVQALLDEGKTVENDRELFEAALMIDPTIVVPPKDLPAYEGDSGDETNHGN